MTKEQQFKSSGYSSNTPCTKCGCTNTVIEPRFGYAVCIDHFLIPPSKITEFKEKGLQRPDLTYLTQSCFSKQDPPNNVVSKIPQLVQAAEILFDKTCGNPGSIEHMFVKQLLECLKEE